MWLHCLVERGGIYNSTCPDEQVRLHRTSYANMATCFSKENIDYTTCLVNKYTEKIFPSSYTSEQYEEEDNIE